MVMSPKASHVLTVENLFLNNVIWRENSGEQCKVDDTWTLNKLMRSSPLKNNSSAMNALMHPETRDIWEITVEESILQKKAYLCVSRASVNSRRNLLWTMVCLQNIKTHTMICPVNSVPNISVPKGIWRNIWPTCIEMIKKFPKKEKTQKCEYCPSWRLVGNASTSFGIS